MQLWSIFPHDESRDDSFTPTELEVLAIEAELPSALAAMGPLLLPRHHPHDAFWERLDQYRRQYFGVVRDGKKLVIGNVVHVGFCDEHWRTRYVGVDDGGYGVLTITYDIAARHIVDVVSNGYA